MIATQRVDQPEPALRAVNCAPLIKHTVSFISNQGAAAQSSALPQMGWSKETRLDLA